jgi:hypothetical protein
MNWPVSALCRHAVIELTGIIDLTCKAIWFRNYRVMEGGVEAPVQWNALSCTQQNGLNHEIPCELTAHQTS